MEMEFEKKMIGAGEVRVGSFVVIDGAPCKVVDIKTSSTGKHGHTKVRIEAIGLIDEKKRVVILPSHEKVEVPIVSKREAQVIGIRENVATLMDMETYETFELEIPPELSGKLFEGETVTYWEVMGKKLLKG